MARQLKRELSRGRTRNALRWLTVVAALALGVWMGETSPAELHPFRSFFSVPPARAHAPPFFLSPSGW